MTANSTADAAASASVNAAAAASAQQEREQTPRKPRKSPAELRAEAQAARLALAQTLDAIEDKVNVPKQAKRAVARVGAGLRKTGEEQPLVLLGIAAGVAALVGVGVWRLVSRLNRR